MSGIYDCIARGAIHQEYASEITGIGASWGFMNDRVKLTALLTLEVSPNNRGRSAFMPLPPPPHSPPLWPPPHHAPSSPCVQYTIFSAVEGIGFRYCTDSVGIACVAIMGANMRWRRAASTPTGSPRIRESLTGRCAAARAAGSPRRAGFATRSDRCISRIGSPFIQGGALPVEG